MRNVVILMGKNTFFSIDIIYSRLYYIGYYLFSDNQLKKKNYFYNIPTLVNSDLIGL